MTFTLISLIFSNVNVCSSFFHYLCFHFSCCIISPFTANVFYFISTNTHAYIQHRSIQIWMKQIWSGVFELSELVELQGKRTHQDRQSHFLVCNECQFVLGVTFVLLHITKVLISQRKKHRCISHFTFLICIWIWNKIAIKPKTA